MYILPNPQKIDMQKNCFTVRLPCLSITDHPSVLNRGFYYDTSHGIVWITVIRSLQKNITLTLTSSLRFSTACFTFFLSVTMKPVCFFDQILVFNLKIAAGKYSA